MVHGLNPLTGQSKDWYLLHIALRSKNKDVLTLSRNGVIPLSAECYTFVLVIIKATAKTIPQSGIIKM